MSTPILPSKSLPNSTTPQTKPSKPIVTAPRIDIEPIYTALQSALGAHDWALYKEAISLFVLGSLNQDELSRRTPFIGVNAQRVHLHNQFIAAVYGNAGRDPPEPGVANWVSANDKPTLVAKPTSGDGAEQRLKTEVMALTGRERRRLKQIQEDPFDMFTRTMDEYHQARNLRLPDATAISAGGFASKTNWEPEIRKRYNQPLFVETNEFPDPETVQARMVPICYEEGLTNGAAAGAAEFVSLAAEFYIKEALSSFIGRVATNGENFVRTGTFKRQLEKEEDMWMRGEIQKNAVGLLPAEVEANHQRKPLNMSDLKIAVQLGDPYLGAVPLLAGQIMASGWADPEEQKADERTAQRAERVAQAPKATINNHLTNGDAMDIDEQAQDFGWQGAASVDQNALHSALDDILAIGD
ncbi:transcriptional co-activator [Pseudovirgaria hyperparasitica]|uniref:Transcriptional co-activator n=1 Tax=Pseudovirgaria hyperparasitica TaxID=470096 RepID=A0A6A6WBK6_9PEZI|nr:transcriptional co-activator [Pseudovirgaria hyperparasitica]KAF2759955.1 transcriptional co-activator [Pseudovirgaria hyperparasitica]